MNRSQLQKLVQSLNVGELKALAEACQKHLTLLEGPATDPFMSLAKELCCEAIRQDLRNPY